MNNYKKVYLVIISVFFINSGYLFGSMIDYYIAEENGKMEFIHDKISLMMSYGLVVSDDINFEPSDDMFYPLIEGCSGALYELTVSDSNIDKGLHFMTRCDDNDKRASEIDLINDIFSVVLAEYNERLQNNAKVGMN